MSDLILSSDELFMEDCNFWLKHYNLLLNRKGNTKEEIVWFEEHFKQNKCYDV